MEDTFEALEAEYRTLAVRAGDFEREVLRQLSELLRNAEVRLAFPVQSRVKEWESAKRTLELKKRQVSSVKELKDLVGFRVILEDRRDASRTKGLIENYFHVLECDDRFEGSSEDRFGYASIQYVVQLDDEWRATPTMTRLENFRAEIQIRTLAQHIWAAASHRLQYKREHDVPKPLQRAINRLSALLEVVDVEFGRLLEARNEYFRSIGDLPPSEPLNVDLLAAILDEKLPEQNKQSTEPYATILEELIGFGIGRTDELNALIDKHLSAAVERDAAKARDVQTGAEYRSPTSRMGKRAAAGYYFDHLGLVREMMRQQDRKVFEKMLKMYDNRP